MKQTRDRIDTNYGRCRNVLKGLSKFCNFFVVCSSILYDYNYKLTKLEGNITSNQ